MTVPEYMERFAISEEVARTERGRKVILNTDYGPKTIWLPRRHWIRYYRYKKENKVIWEVWIPQQFAIKTGLI